MLNRRQLIGRSVAASAAVLGARLVGAMPAPEQTNRLKADFLLIESRFSQSQKLAKQFSAPGARTINLPRDGLGLWHEQLLPAISAAPQKIAGVTSERSFFLLSTLAADQRLRVLHSTIHRARPHSPHDENLVSWLIGPPDKAI